MVLDRWVVRKSEDGGTTWATVDEYQLNNADHSRGIMVFTTSSGVVLTSGNSNDSGSSHWDY